MDTSEGQIKTTQSGNSDYLCSSNQPKRLVSTPINQVGSAAPQQVQSALNNAVRVITFNPALNSDILVAFRGLEDQIIDAITNRFTQNRGIRAYLTADVSYTRENVDGVQQLEQHLRSSALIFNSADDMEHNVAEMMREIFARSEEFEGQGSGWNFEKVINIKLHLATYAPLSGSSYIPTPKAIQATRGVLNITNEDEKCIIWCILAHLHPAKNNNSKVYNYRLFEHELKTAGVNFPTPVKDVPKLERLNDLSINVFGYDTTDKLYPLYKSKKNCKPARRLNLLLIAQGDKRHYCLIRNFSRLMAYRTKHKAALYYCFNCLHGYSKKRILEEHEKLCHKQKVQSISFPKKPEEKEIFLKTLKSNYQCLLLFMRISSASLQKLIYHKLEKTRCTKDMYPLDFHMLLCVQSKNIQNHPSYTEEKMLLTHFLKNCCKSIMQLIAFFEMKSL